MILVDSSVLIAFLRGDGGPEARRLEQALVDRATVGLEPHVFQEVLQGARDEAEWLRLDAYLSTQVMYRLRHGIDSHREAARIYHDCRRRGLTVRSIVDCLIAQTALDNDVALLARDRDYRSIAEVRPLRMWL
jgi:hypothetical protein